MVWRKLTGLSCSVQISAFNLLCSAFVICERTEELPCQKLISGNASVTQPVDLQEIHSSSPAFLPPHVQLRALPVPWQAQCFLFALIPPLSWQQTPVQSTATQHSATRAGGSIPSFWNSIPGGCSDCPGVGRLNPTLQPRLCSCHLWAVKCLPTPVFSFLDCVCCRHTAVVTGPGKVRMNDFSIR